MRGICEHGARTSGKRSVIRGISKHRGDMGEKCSQMPGFSERNCAGQGSWQTPQSEARWIG